MGTPPAQEKTRVVRIVRPDLVGAYYLGTCIVGALLVLIVVAKYLGF